MPAHHDRPRQSLPVRNRRTQRASRRKGIGYPLPYAVPRLYFQCLTSQLAKHDLCSLATSQEKQPIHLDSTPRNELSCQPEPLRLIFPLKLANGNHKLLIRENIGSRGRKIGFIRIHSTNYPCASGMCHIHQPILRTG